MKRISTAAGARGGFTLIELLAVITIILILAGLILAIAGHAQFKGAQARAQSEIQALSSSIGNYQIDNGTFPRDTSSAKVTDTLDARNPATYSDPATSAYTSTSQYLYQTLCGAYYYSATNSKLSPWVSGNADNAPKPTVYFPFKDNQLKYNSTITDNPADVAAILDPFGFSYGYSTAYQADVDNNVSPPTHGYNPTFDLWSTSGYSTSQGKALPANTTAANVANLWIKNW